ncbi:uncharacterized protein LOC143145469 [Ptiloglossa arizonensis]|uniref:uncharacterized protein LOC143145469 n=1 Tax=Ptiloglossa arizonensis TaxID=3350558 RepID=UPI003F9F48BB
MRCEMSPPTAKSKSGVCATGKNKGGEKSSEETSNAIGDDTARLRYARGKTSESSCVTIEPVQKMLPNRNFRIEILEKQTVHFLQKSVQIPTVGNNGYRPIATTVAETAANDSISTRRCTSAAAAYLEYDSLAKVLLPTGSTSPGALRETIRGIAGKTMTDRIECCPRRSVLRTTTSLRQSGYIQLRVTELQGPGSAPVVVERRLPNCGPYCWIRGRTARIYPRPREKRGLEPFMPKGRQSAIGPSSFCLACRSDNGEIPLVRQTDDRAMPACLPARPMTDDSRPTYISRPRRAETNFYPTNATRNRLMVEESGTTNGDAYFPLKNHSASKTRPILRSSRNTMLQKGDKDHECDEIWKLSLP